jgi:hypothetical protein
MMNEGRNFCKITITIKAGSQSRTSSASTKTVILSRGKLWQWGNYAMKLNDVTQCR